MPEATDLELECSALYANFADAAPQDSPGSSPSPDQATKQGAPDATDPEQECSTLYTSFAGAAPPKGAGERA